LQLPGVKVLELQSQPAAQDSRVSIIFITAYDDTKSRRRAMQAGAVAFPAKPFGEEQLLQTIHSALQLCESLGSRRHDRPVVEVQRIKLLYPPDA
jgi:FixJ family two-component response regulator